MIEKSDTLAKATQEAYKFLDLEIKPLEQNILDLRKSVKNLTEDNLSLTKKQIGAYQSILSLCTSLISKAETLQADSRSDLFGRLHLIKAECYIQIIEIELNYYSTTNVSLAESRLIRYKQLAEESIDFVDRDANPRLVETLDDLKNRWAANLWTIGELYYANELSHIFSPNFDKTFDITKKYFRDAKKYFASINDLDQRKSAMLSTGGNLLRTAKMYMELALIFFSLTEINPCDVKIVNAPTDLDKKEVVNKKTILFIIRDNKLQIGYCPKKLYKQLDLNSPELLELCRKYQPNQLITDTADLCKINALLASAKPEVQISNNQIIMMGLKKAISIYKEGLYILGNNIKNKTHTDLLIGLCHAYRMQITLFEKNLSKEERLDIHQEIIYFAGQIELQNKVSQQIVWDNKLIALSYLFNSYLYLFYQEPNDSPTNKYGNILLAAANKFTECYFAYASSVKKTKYIDMIVKDHDMAGVIKSMYGKVSFVRSSKDEALCKDDSRSCPLEFKECPENIDSEYAEAFPSNKYKRLGKAHIKRDHNLSKSPQHEEKQSPTPLHKKTTDEQLNIEAQAFGFKCHNMPDDGDCFFHAIAHQLNSLNLSYLGSTHLEVRAIAIDYILNNLSQYQEFIGEREGNMHQFITENVIKGTWADHIIISAVSRALNLNIAIIKSNGSDPSVIKQSKALITLYVGHETDKHYQSLLENKSLVKSKFIQPFIDKATCDAFSQTVSKSRPDVTAEKRVSVARSASVADCKPVVAKPTIKKPVVNQTAVAKPVAIRANVAASDQLLDSNKSAVNMYSNTPFNLEDIDADVPKDFSPPRVFKRLKKSSGDNPTPVNGPENERTNKEERQGINHLGLFFANKNVGSNQRQDALEPSASMK
jgi:hypothetical protein